MDTKDNTNNLANLAKFRAAIERLNLTLENLRLEVIALLHDKESLQRENEYLRSLLNES